MGILGPGDVIPVRPRRVLVAGSSGSGKTTVAATVGQRLGLPHVELDSLYHGPDWVPREPFAVEVEAFSREPRWVTEWQYGAVRDLLAARADLLVWLDLPRRTVLRQVVQRTLRRRLRREVLWNGNTEPPLRTVLTNPEHVVRWSWRTHARTGPRVREASRRRPDLVVVRLRRRSEVNRWLNSLGTLSSG